mgnify:CR=1 FL=1
MYSEPIELVPGALLFKNVLSDSKISYRTILNSKNDKDSIFKWETWNVFGNQSVVIPDYDNHYLAPQTFEQQLQKECIDLFYNLNVNIGLFFWSGSHVKYKKNQGYNLRG